VKDLTINDATKIAPGTSFEKAWVLRAGKTGVPLGCDLVFVGGHHLNAKKLRVPVEDAPIESGHEFVLRVKFDAPATPGHYRSFWRLQTRNGRRFGPRIWADIFVTEDVAQPSGSPAMALDAHVTLLPGASITAGEEFAKTWLVSTSTGWEQGCKLKCIDAWSSFAGLDEEVPAVPAGSQAELSITLSAPMTPGVYRSLWSLFDNNGSKFGDDLPVEFRVVPAVASASEADVDDVIDECLSSVDGDDEHAKAVEEAKKLHAQIHNEAVADAKKATEDSNKSDDDLNPQLLQQILAGINVLTNSDKQKQLSNILFACLSTGDFTPAIEALSKSNINIEQKE
jgi:hypothetical protein